MPCCAKLPSEFSRGDAPASLGRRVQSIRDAWRGLLRLLVRTIGAAALLTAVGLAQGAEISVRNAQLGAGREGYSLAAEFGILLNGRVEEAVNKGVVLHFVIEFELTRSRWYWFDEQVVRRNRSVQLAYLALTRQYRVSVGSQHQTFATLGEALRAMSSLNHWAVLEKSWVKPDETYQAALQMRLDLSQMPKTFQVSALSSKDWVLSSGWWRWAFVPREALTLPALEASPAATGLQDVPPMPAGGTPSLTPEPAEVLRLPTDPVTDVK